jgi:hypothetical protein
MALEVLDRALVLLCSSAAGEGAKVAALACLWIDLA